MVLVEMPQGQAQGQVDGREQWMMAVVEDEGQPGEDREQQVRPHHHTHHTRVDVRQTEHTLQTHHAIRSINRVGCACFYPVPVGVTSA